MTDSPEYNAIFDCIPELRLSVQTNLGTLGGQLLAGRLINSDKERALRNRNVDEADRAADLVDLVLGKVQENPNNYHKFVEILNKDKRQYDTVITKLDEKYRSYKGESGQEPKDPAPAAAKGQESSKRLKRSGKPKRHELGLIEVGGKSVKVISKSAADWEKIATRLHFDGSMIGAIRKNPDSQTAEERCAAVFDKWLKGSDDLREPVSWATVVKVLKEAEHGALSAELDSILSD